MTNQNERFSLNNNLPKTFLRYYDIMPHVSIVTSLINLLRPNNNMNLNIQNNIDIMPLVNIVTSPNEWFRLSKNRNKAFHLIFHYATCHYHICCLLSHVGCWRPHNVKACEQRCVHPRNQIPTSPLPHSR